MARPARHSDDTLIELFLDMLAAERGAGENTLAAYRRDLDDFARIPRHQAPHRRERGDRRRARLSAVALEAQLRRGVGRAAAVRDPAALSLPLCRRAARRRSRRHHRRAEARTRAAEGAQRQGGRSPARHRPQGDRHRTHQRRAAAGGAAQCAAGARLRHRTARVRTGVAAGLGGGAQRPHAGGARQGRQGAAGAAQRRRQDRDDGVSRAAWRSASSARRESGDRTTTRKPAE